MPRAGRVRRADDWHPGGYASSLSRATKMANATGQGEYHVRRDGSAQAPTRWRESIVRACAVIAAITVAAGSIESTRPTP